MDIGGIIFLLIIFGPFFLFVTAVLRSRSNKQLLHAALAGIVLVFLSFLAIVFVPSGGATLLGGPIIILLRSWSLKIGKTSGRQYNLPDAVAVILIGLMVWRFNYMDL